MPPFILKSPFHGSSSGSAILVYRWEQRGSEGFRTLPVSPQCHPLENEASWIQIQTWLAPKPIGLSPQASFSPRTAGSRGRGSGPQERLGSSVEPGGAGLGPRTLRGAGSWRLHHLFPSPGPESPPQRGAAGHRGTGGRPTLVALKTSPGNHGREGRPTPQAPQHEEGCPVGGRSSQQEAVFLPDLRAVSRAVR